MHIKSNYFLLYFLFYLSLVHLDLNAKTKRVEFDNQIIAQDLNTPWEMVFLPDGDFLVTERGGFIRRFGKQNEKYAIPDAYEIGEGGLLGMALDPDFSKTGFLYLYLTTKEKNTLKNQVMRYIYKNNQLTNKKIILDNIPAARFHNGGRIAFGPDGYLYITTGDALKPETAQDLNSLAGKILRITKEGLNAPGNPFSTPVYSYGHRNPQGIAWDNKGNLWATEHGNNAHDEVNIIYKGNNYGWPLTKGYEQKKNMVPPVLTSGEETWAPSGMTIWDNFLFFSSLRGQTLFSLDISMPLKEPKLQRFFKKQFGRLRALALSPDKSALYLLTSNRDGRGNPQPTDDRIIKISILNENE